MIDSIQIIKAGNGTTDKIFFTMDISAELKTGCKYSDIIPLLEKAQEKAGYPSVAYGGPEAIVIKFTTISWFCYASCD